MSDNDLYIQSGRLAHFTTSSSVSSASSNKSASTSAQSASSSLNSLDTVIMRSPSSSWTFHVPRTILSLHSLSGSAISQISNANTLPESAPSESFRQKSRDSRLSIGISTDTSSLSNHDETSSCSSCCSSCSDLYSSVGLSGSSSSSNSSYCSRSTTSNEFSKKCISTSAVTSSALFIPINPGHSSSGLEPPALKQSDYSAANRESLSSSCESPTSVTAINAGPLPRSVPVHMELPDDHLRSISDVMPLSCSAESGSTPCCRYSCCQCCQCCSWHTTPEPIVLLACGSFNPITTMHMRMMELARDAIERTWSFPPDSSDRELSVGDILEEESSHGGKSRTANQPCRAYFVRPPRRQVVVAGVFSPVSDAYAKAGLAQVDSRCRLARLACATTSDWLAVDSWEANQPGWTDTCQVLKHFQSRLDEISALSASEVEKMRNEQSCDLKQSQYSESESHKNLHTSANGLPGSVTNSWLLTKLDEVQRSIGICNESIPVVKPCNCLRKRHRLFDTKSVEQTTELQCFSCRLPNARVKLVCGADLLLSFAVPGLWSEADIESLVRDYGIVCISRPNCDVTRLIHEMDVLSRYEQNIIIATEWCQNGLSATLVRRALARGQSVRYLVPDAALEEIYATGLYGAKRRRTVGTTFGTAATSSLGKSENVSTVSPNLPVEKELPAESSRIGDLLISTTSESRTPCYYSPESLCSQPFYDINYIERQYPLKSSPSSTHCEVACKEKGTQYKTYPKCNHSVQTRLTSIPCTHAPIVLRRVILDPKIKSIKSDILTQKSKSALTAILPLLKQCTRCGSETVRLLLIERPSSLKSEQLSADNFENSEAPQTSYQERRTKRKQLENQTDGLRLKKSSSSTPTRFQTQPIMSSIKHRHLCDDQRYPSSNVTFSMKDDTFQRVTRRRDDIPSCLLNLSNTPNRKENSNRIRLSFNDDAARLRVRSLPREAIQRIHLAHSPSCSRHNSHMSSAFACQMREMDRVSRELPHRTEKLVPVSRCRDVQKHSHGEHFHNKAKSTRIDLPEYLCRRQAKMEAIPSQETQLPRTNRSKTRNPSERSSTRQRRNYDEVDKLLYNLCLNIESAL